MDGSKAYINSCFVTLVKPPQGPQVILQPFQSLLNDHDTAAAFLLASKLFSAPSHLANESSSGAQNR